MAVNAVVILHWRVALFSRDFSLFCQSWALALFDFPKELHTASHRTRHHHCRLLANASALDAPQSIQILILLFPSDIFMISSCHFSHVNWMRCDVYICAISISPAGAWTFWYSYSTSFCCFYACSCAYPARPVRFHRTSEEFGVTCEVVKFIVYYIFFFFSKYVM